MAKRTVIRIGDIFCAEIDGKFKCYFQYICRDETMMNTQVIRVFNKHYPLSYNPEISEIINDSISFYAHAPIKVGIHFNAWYKVDKCKILPDAKEINNILFGYCSESFCDGCSIDYEDEDPIDNWLIWNINKPMKHLHLHQLTQQYRDSLFNGALEAFCDIVNRIKYGYYWYQDEMYDVIRRIPRPDVDSYCRRTSETVTVYYHFHGENLVQEVFLENGVSYRLSRQEPISDRYCMDAIKFWDINWKYDEFITEDEFHQVWDN